MTSELSTSTMTRLVDLADNEVKLPSPVKSPFLIEVIRLEERSLRTIHEIKEQQSRNAIPNQVPAKLALLHAGTAVNPLPEQNGKHVGHAKMTNLTTDTPKELEKVHKPPEATKSAVSTNTTSMLAPT